MFTTLLVAHSHTESFGWWAVQAVVCGSWAEPLGHHSNAATELPPPLLLFIMPHKNVASIYHRNFSLMCSFFIHNFQPNSCYSHHYVLHIWLGCVSWIFGPALRGACSRQTTEVYTHSSVMSCPCCWFLHKGKFFSSLLWPCCLHWEGRRGTLLILHL